ncbi:MAG: potassium channel family protein [Bdellovibrionales bacterium]|nr:potassium channel family protein [Bdellovibrionales bacterium]
MAIWVEYFRFLIKKIFSPPILLLTLAGNTLILMFSVIFYFTEYGKNKDITNLFDAVWWAFSTVTTVGYGDLVPATLAGRVISIFLMLMGTGLFVAHTALLANAFLDKKLFLLFNKKNKTSKKEEQKAYDQRSLIIREEQDIHQLLNEIKDKVDRFDEWINKQQKKESSSEKNPANM